jgi:hypothetical protein
MLNLDVDSTLVQFSFNIVSLLGKNEVPAALIIDFDIKFAPFGLITK